MTQKVSLNVNKQENGFKLQAHWHRTSVPSVILKYFFAAGQLVPCFMSGDNVLSLKPTRVKFTILLCQYQPFP